MVKPNLSYTHSTFSDRLYPAVTSNIVCQLSTVNLAETPFFESDISHGNHSDETIELNELSVL
jgi:hypothetical protein